MSAVGETRELGCTLPSGGIGREPNGRAGTIRIIVQSVNRHCYSSASLPDGTVLVACSRQPFLDAARVLIAAGHDPNSWLEGWRPGSMAFALSARLGIAAGLTIDETRTVFAKWKPFSVRHQRWSQPVDATLYLKGKRWSVAMDQGFRRGFTTAEKTELWDRWQRGESLKAIGRAFGKPSSSIYFQVSPYGGIRPAPRRRSRLALTLPEREEISRGIAIDRPARWPGCWAARPRR